MSDPTISSAPEGEDLIDRSWRRVHTQMQKQGFREGALKGKEDSYQNGFNLGYPEGFKVGEASGFRAGSLSVLSYYKVNTSQSIRELNDSLNSEELCKSCILCLDKNGQKSWGSYEIVAFATSADVQLFFGDGHSE